MRKVLILAALTMTIAAAMWAQPAQSTDATGAWNNYAASYGFGTFPQSPTATFEMAYSGGDFETDFRAILGDVAAELQTAIPPFEGNEPFNGSLIDW